jgi:hypothetical protein
LKRPFNPSAKLSASYLQRCIRFPIFKRIMKSVTTTKSSF